VHAGIEEEHVRKTDLKGFRSRKSLRNWGLGLRSHLPLFAVVVTPPDPIEKPYTSQTRN
jgi:hypothetical protein